MSKIIIVGAGVAGINAATKLVEIILKEKLKLLIWVKTHMIDYLKK